MTPNEYKEIQERLSKKLKSSSRKNEPYNEAILAAKSIVKSVYESRHSKVRKRVH